MMSDNAQGMPLMGGEGMAGGGMGDGGLGGGGMGGGGMGGGGMGGPLIPQLLQRSPTMETNPANRFGVPEGPMGEMPSMGSMPPREMSPMGEMPSMRRFSPMEEMSPLARMGPMGDMAAMGRMGQAGPIMNSMPGMFPMSPMSPSAPYDQNVLRRKNALEFWGMPNQDQLRALARGENVQKVLGTNRYGESLGGITGGGMNFRGGVNPGMGGPSFNANGMGASAMMGRFGGAGGAMFHGMSGRPSGMMESGMRRNSFFKKDDISKTDEYKKSMKLKKSRDGKDATVGRKKDDGKVASGSAKSEHEGEKFEEGILKKAEGLVAGEKHIAKNEETELHRDHRVRKASKMAHDEEKRYVSCSFVAFHAPCLL